MCSGLTHQEPVEPAFQSIGFVLQGCEQGDRFAQLGVGELGQVAEKVFPQALLTAVQQVANQQRALRGSVPNRPSPETRLDPGTLLIQDR
jgi:hypothetical protein